jgi:hypothetical protein
MRKILSLALLALTAGFALPSGAQAQYYGGGYYPAPPPPPPPGYYRPRPDYGPPPGYYGGGYGRVRFGTICVTSRGQCSVGRPLPINTGCSCFIPGFGQKRGAVGY